MRERGARGYRGDRGEPGDRGDRGDLGGPGDRGHSDNRPDPDARADPRDRGQPGPRGDPGGGGRATLRSARPEDLSAVAGLLTAADLPRDGVAEWLPRFVVAERAGAIVAAAGMELYGRAALLRSVVVAPELRGSGVGAELTERIAADAANAGARMLYLLTTTAADYFPRLGFERIARADLPEALSASQELRGACPVTAVVMARPLGR